MSRKAATKGKEDGHDPDAAESKRLFEAGMNAGVLSRTRRLASSSLPPTKLMLRADGKDIVKKASNRKGRYLLVFNFQLAPAAAGKLGSLAKLDSKNPVMYLDFPQGRYKLFGTLVFPRNKYVVLRMGQKEVLCEDVLESMVVFTEGWWIGTAEDNPTEQKLPEPDWLMEPKLHEKFDFSGRGAAAAGTGKDADAAEVLDEEEEEEPASQRPQRQARRAAGGKRLRYAEDDDGAETDSDGESDGDGEPAPRKLPRLGSQQRQERKSQAKQQPESHPIDLEDSDGDRKPRPLQAGKQATLDAFVKRSSQLGTQPKSRAKGMAAGSGGRKQRQAAVLDSDDDSDVDLADSSASEGDTDAPPSDVRPRSQRKAAGAASKKLRMPEEEDVCISDDERGAGGMLESDGDDDAAEERVTPDSGDEGSDYQPSG